MTAMFPDSGVPPADARNSLPDPNTTHCNELWYSTSRCQPRFDPAAANAVLAELVNLINAGEVQYDCQFLDQVQLSVKYLIQRGLPHSALLVDGPSAYTAQLSPRATRLSDFMTLTVVPTEDSAAGATFDLDGRGVRPIVRSDGEAIQRMDMRKGTPAILVYYAGKWWLVSDLPPPPAQVDVWIRTDGNDVTGDGSANLPEKAFKTVHGAWGRVTARFGVFPATVIQMKLGIPGTYEGGKIGPFGGAVSLKGDINNPTAYRIVAPPIPQLQGGLVGFAVDALELEGLTVVQMIPSSQTAHALGCLGTSMFIKNIRIEAGVNHPDAILLSIGEGGIFGVSQGDLIIEGNGNSARSSIHLEKGTFHGSQLQNIIIRNITNNQTVFLGELSTLNFHGAVVGGSAVNGPRYNVQGNSVLLATGATIPGSAAGVTSFGGQYIP